MYRSGSFVSRLLLMNLTVKRSSCVAYNAEKIHCLGIEPLSDEPITSPSLANSEYSKLPTFLPGQIIVE